jgi:hypothetical protein
VNSFNLHAGLCPRAANTSLIAPTLFTVAAQTAGGQARRLETTPANKE